MAEPTKAEAAQRYAKAGMPVFPLGAGSKLPAIPSAHPTERGSECKGECGRDGHGLYDATTDPDKIAYWWRQDPDRNVGIATGAPGPDVVDVDVKPGGSGEPHWRSLWDAGLVKGYHAVVKTPGTGRHFYFEGTDQGNGRLKDHLIDFRAKGGYVAAPPSADDRGSYRVIEHGDRTGKTVDWQAVREHLVPVQRQVQPVRVREGDSGSLERLHDWCASRKESDRNFPIFYAAKQLEHQGELDDHAVERLVDAARKSGLRGGEREARKSIESGRKSAQREMRPKGGAQQREAS